MHKRILAALIGALIAASAAPAHAVWKTYICKDLGFSFAAPGEVKAELGTFRGEVAGPRQSIVFRSSEANIEYKVTVLSFTQAQMDGATLLGEREFMFRRGNKVVMDAFSQLGTGKDTVYGHKIVVDLPKSRTMAALYFANGKLYTLEAALPANDDYTKPDIERFINSITFDLSHPEQGAIEIHAPAVG